LAAVIDPTPVLAWGQLLLVAVAICGTLVSFGMLIARLNNLAHDHESLKDKFEKHVANADIHTSGRDLSDRIEWLERRGRNGS